MAAMMPSPTHFRGELFRVLLHRRRSARIDQRYRLRALDRSDDNKQGADGRKAQNFRSVHQHSPSVISRQRRAAALVQLPRRDTDEIREIDVNDD
jgi:hypothetical protein